jgi:hypothetical protein
MSEKTLDRVVMTVAAVVCALGYLWASQSDFEEARRAEVEAAQWEAPSMRLGASGEPSGGFDGAFEDVGAWND